MGIAKPCCVASSAPRLAHQVLPSLLKVQVGHLVPDSVTSSQSNPLRNGSVLLLRFGELLLRSKRLVALSKNC